MCHAADQPFGLIRDREPPPFGVTLGLAAQVPAAVAAGASGVSVGLAGIPVQIGERGFKLRCGGARHESNPVLLEHGGAPADTGIDREWAHLRQQRAPLGVGRQPGHI